MILRSRGCFSREELSPSGDKTKQSKKAAADELTSACDVFICLHLSFSVQSVSHFFVWYAESSRRPSLIGKEGTIGEVKPIERGLFQLSPYNNLIRFYRQLLGCYDGGVCLFR